MHATSSSAMSIFCYTGFLSWPQDWVNVLGRLKMLEEAQQATVETSLQNVRVLLKSPFSWV